MATRQPLQAGIAVDDRLMFAMNPPHANWTDTTLFEHPAHIYSIDNATIRKPAFFSCQNCDFDLIAERKHGEPRG